MSLLIFQVVIKQWDKSQNTPSFHAKRAAEPAAYRITSQPNFQVLGKPCILDFHGDDLATDVFPNGRIETAVLSKDRIQFDRFQVCATSNGEVLDYLSAGKIPQTIGPLNQGWIQCIYHWRYSVIEKEQLYWMYEEVILNAVCLEKIDQDFFLRTSPSIVFVD